MTTAVTSYTNGTAIVPAEANVSTLGDLMRVGAQLAKSGFFSDAKVEAQAVAKVLAGAELGISPVAAMMGIHFFNGKLSLSANLIAGIIKRQRHRYDYRVVKLDNDGCELAFFESGREVGRSSFTMKDAANASLAGDVWKKYPRNLCFARALTNGARLYCPDIFIGGVYTPEEMGEEVDGETGEILSPVTSVSSEPMRESTVFDDRGADAARRRFFAVARERGYNKQREIHAVLGIPEEEGALKRWADRYGWDTARKLLEDGLTIQDWHAAQHQDVPADVEPLPFDPDEASDGDAAEFPGMPPEELPQNRRGAH